MISFYVPGVPAPQGSKTPWGTEANPRTKPWRAAVAAAALEAMDGRPPIVGPVRLSVWFTFPRPKSHYRTGKNAHRVRDAAPAWHSQKPDLDKLVRAVGDALTGVVLRDDSLIVSLRVSKQWAQSSGARISVYEDQEV